MPNSPINKDSSQGSARQRAGRACNNCRRRKMGCDRRAPCSACKEQGMDCNFDAPAATRGPKRGYIEALRSRIGMCRLSGDGCGCRADIVPVSLEQRLEDAGHGQGSAQPSQQPSPSSEGRSPVDMSGLHSSALQTPSSAFDNASAASYGFPMDFNMDLESLTEMKQDMKNAPMFIPEMPTPYMMPQSDEEAIRTMTIFEVPSDHQMPGLTPSSASSSSRSGSRSSGSSMPPTPGGRHVNLTESQCVELEQAFL